MSDPLRLRADATCWADLEAGEFCYAKDHDGRVKWLHFWPVDSRAPLSASIRPQRNDMGASWDLSGSESAPTLMPSVNWNGGWHGWLRDGVATQG